MLRPFGPWILGLSQEPSTKGRLCSSLCERECQVPLRNPTGADEMWTDQRVPPRVAAQRDGRRRLVQFPTGRFVPAAHAFQEHPLPAELQQVVVTAHATAELPHAVQDSRP